MVEGAMARVAHYDNCPIKDSIEHSKERGQGNSLSVLVSKQNLLLAYALCLSFKRRNK